MNAPRLYDITEVCRLLNTTSRTLRFYEEKGIIAGTRSPYSPRRRYTEEQVAHIRYVLILRALGLSVKAISDLQHRGIDLRQAILSKRAEIYAAVESLTRELRVLNEALSLIEAGAPIDRVDTERGEAAYAGEYAPMLRQCTEAIVKGDTERLYRYITPILAAAMPPDAFERARAETLEPLGGPVSYGDLTASPDHPAIFVHRVRYERLCLKITYVLTEGRIDGLWMTYCEV